MSTRKSILSLFVIVAALQGGAATVAPQKLERDGVSVEFTSSANAVEGQEVDLRFAIRAADGTPLTGVRPAAWIDSRAAEGSCKDKIQSFLSATLRARPQVDLNSYYIVTLNAEPSIAVIDPLLGFGGTRLLTAVTLQSPGVDWAMSRDQKRLFVSMPLVNRVAAIDTGSWSLIQNIDTAFRPTRVALDPAGEQLWVLSETAITVIDTRTLAVTKSLESARGPHAIAFDGKYAFVTNGAEGTVSVFDAATLAKVEDIRTGSSADALALSTLASTLYVVDGKDGIISVIDPAKRKVTARIEAKPGLNSIQFAPGGRWGFVTNEKEKAVHVIDSSNATVITTAHDVGARPDQIAFSDEFAYVRAAGADQVKMIRLSALASGEEPAMAVFPGGQRAPAEARADSFAAAIVPAPEPKAMLVANPADKLVYFYSEGMAAPMGNFAAPKRTPKAVLVLDRSLRESEPSVFSIRTKVAAAGTYDVAFFLNNPRVIHCFTLAVEPDPNAVHTPAQRTARVEPLFEKKPIHAGEEVEVKFRLTDPDTHEPHRDVRDLRALAFLAPGTWQTRIAAQAEGEGVYRFKVPVQESGIYYVFVESASLNLKINKARPLIFEALGREPE